MARIVAASMLTGEECWSEASDEKRIFDEDGLMDSRPALERDMYRLL